MHNPVRPRIRCRTCSILVALISLGYAGIGAAAPEEIQVYMDDLSKPGESGVDVHNNYVISGDRNQPYPGGQAPNHVYRLTPEFYYGVSNTVELGFYLLTTREPDRDPRFDGSKVRIKFIAPHDPNNGFYWGANLEIGRTDLRVSEVPWNSEIKAIFGYRSGPWTYAVTPNLEVPLSTHGGPVSSEIHSKIAYSISPDTMLGFESYNELGPISHSPQLHDNGQTLYAAVDHDFHSFDLNAGIGRGLTAESDQWVVKFIVGAHF
jgi:hypothetical protein